MSLIKDYQVPKLAGLRESLPLCELRQLEIIEYKLFKDCLGLDFRTDLIADLVDNSAVEEYDDTKPYAIGEKASWDQFIYEAILVTTGNRPDNILFWKDAPMFGEDLYNTLWCEYLGPYIAYHIAKHSITSNSIYFTSQGAVRRSGDGYSAASSSEINLLIQNFEAQITMTLDVMIDWMKTEKDGGSALFDNYLGFENCSTGDCLEQAQKRHRWRVA